jgi:DNA-3-methyladenine glycosylase II
MHMMRSKQSRIIETDADMRAGIRALRRKCAHLRRAHDFAGDPPLRRHAPGFEGLARIVVGQQLSIASAEAIWRRLTLAVRPMAPRRFLKLSDDQLRQAGLSRGKVRTLRAVSEAIEGGLDLESVCPRAGARSRTRPRPRCRASPWSADIFLLFASAGPMPLQRATSRCRPRWQSAASSERPSARAARHRGALAPWRGVAAHMLWAYYDRSPRARSGPEKRLDSLRFAASTTPSASRRHQPRGASQS